MQLDSRTWEMMALLDPGIKPVSREMVGIYVLQIVFINILALQEVFLHFGSRCFTGTFLETAVNSHLFPFAHTSAITARKY